MVIFQCNQIGLNTRRRLAHKAKRRTEGAYAALWALCSLACIALVWLGAGPYGQEDITHPVVIACALGAAACFCAALWFLAEAPKAARDAYLAVLFERG